MAKIWVGQLWSQSNQALLVPYCDISTCIAAFATLEHHQLSLTIGLLSCLFCGLLLPPPLPILNGVRPCYLTMHD
jgi:hypothetical protein